MRYVLHDWDEERAAAILVACRRGMRAGTRLLVVDQILPRRAANTPEDRLSLTLDLHMYVLFGARVPAAHELRGLLEDAHFEVERIAPTRPASTIIARAI